MKLLPTPAAQDGHKAPQSYAGGLPTLPGAVEDPTRWGQYAAAIQRWERLTRPAPAPTSPVSTGRQRVSPLFVEWMMGLPEGWVTAVPGLSRNDALQALGNGVVPAQAAAALSIMLEGGGA